MKPGRIRIRGRDIRRGVGSYEEVLTAAQVLVGAKAVLSAAERDLGLARLALHRALGGAWTADDVEYLRQSQADFAPFFASFFAPWRAIAIQTNE